MAKLYVTEKFVEHTSNLLQLWGGWGYMWEYPIGILSKNNYEYIMFTERNTVETFTTVFYNTFDKN